jgi:SAM-dependent methyltransferase
MKCRHCGVNLKRTFVDLGSAPPSNSYLTKQTLKESEKWYQLRVLVCQKCWLVQTEDYVGVGELFSADYAYFSSYSVSWLNQARDYVNNVIARFSLTSDSTVVEIAANDGYLLQYVNQKGIPCYGIEPTSSTAQAAREKDIEIFEDFFGFQKAKDFANLGRQADLLVANNVLAHVPDINDFVKGFSVLLKPNGVATFEFPHLLNLVHKNQFDTIYHEHYSYLSLTATKAVFEANGLRIFDVEQLPSHGGSLRIYAQRSDSVYHPLCRSVSIILDKECTVGINSEKYYKGFQEKIDTIKYDFLKYLIDLKQQGKKVVAYGAAAKGNTFLNYLGIRPDLISFVADRNPVKQGKYMPGSRIPILEEDQIKITKPDYVVILPWNLQEEIVSQLDYIRKWNGNFIVAIPQLKLL